MPKYKHDCDTCKFIKSYERLGVTYDVYFCNGTLLARFGNKPDQYLSSDLKELLWAELKSSDSVLKNVFADNLDKFDIVFKNGVNNVSFT